MSRLDTKCKNKKQTLLAKHDKTDGQYKAVSISYLVYLEKTDAW